MSTVKQKVDDESPDSTFPLKQRKKINQKQCDFRIFFCQFKHELRAHLYYILHNLIVDWMEGLGEIESILAILSRLKIKI